MFSLYYCKLFSVLLFLISVEKINCYQNNDYFNAYNSYAPSDDNLPRSNTNTSAIESIESNKNNDKYQKELFLQSYKNYNNVHQIYNSKLKIKRNKRKIAMETGRNNEIKSFIDGEKYYQQYKQNRSWMNSLDGRSNTTFQRRRQEGMFLNTTYVREVPEILDFYNNSSNNSKVAFKQNAIYGISALNKIRTQNYTSLINNSLPYSRRLFRQKRSLNNDKIKNIDLKTNENLPSNFDDSESRNISSEVKELEDHTNLRDIQMEDFDDVTFVYEKKVLDLLKERENQFDQSSDISDNSHLNGLTDERSTKRINVEEAIGMVNISITNNTQDYEDNNNKLTTLIKKLTTPLQNSRYGINIHRIIYHDEIPNDERLLGHHATSSPSQEPQDDTVLIQVPPRRIRCQPPKRLARGHCRTVW